MSNGGDRDRGECETQKEFDWTIETHSRKLRAWRPGVITGEQEMACIKHKVSGWDQLRSSESKEATFGRHIVRQLSSVQKEQLRMASPAEREMREILMRIGGDDPDERSTHGVPRQQDLTQR